jgi:hypothetical protein
MNLKDAMLCIDCDEVFTIEGAPTNPHCPRCASSIFVPLSTWIPTWAALDYARGEDNSLTLKGAAIRKPTLRIVRPTAVAA